MPERGASLIELILVVGIVGLMVAFAGENFVGGMSRYHDKSVTTELAAELRTARHLAITRREPVRIVFEAEGTRLRTERANAPGLALRQYEYSGRGIVVEGYPMVHRSCSTPAVGRPLLRRSRSATAVSNAGSSL